MSDFIRIPPDGEGKRIRHVNRQDLSITSTSVDLNDIQIGDVITSSGGATGRFTGWKTVAIQDGIDISVGEVVGTFTIAETISHPTLGILGTLTDTSTSIYTPSIAMADADSPYNTQKIDKNGSSFIRFTEGDQPFDAFGHTQTSENTIVDVHSFNYGDNPTRYYDQEVTGGSVSVNAIQSELILSTTATSGSKASRTTNQYYPYTPGIGTELLVSARAGDVGKDNLFRRMGMYDDLNGVFFEQSGSAMNVVLRSNVTGTVVEERVTQTEFNGDQLTNTATDEFLLDFTKYNLYWLDFQWLGVGKIRMGTYAPTGKRVVMHTFQNPNIKIYAWAQTGTLPFRVEQFNQDTTISSSEMRVVCVSIIKQSDVDTFKGETFTTVVESVPVSGSGFVPLISARPSGSYNGIPNRTTVIPMNIETIVDGDPIRVDVIANPSLSGSTWTAADNPFSATELDQGATSYTGGSRFETVFAPSGMANRELEENLDNTLNLSADGVSQPILTFAAKTVKNTGTANVSMIVRWREAR